MNGIIEVVKQGSLTQKSLFLMAAGLLFVFTVQVVFYLIIKLWPKKRKDG